MVKLLAFVLLAFSIAACGQESTEKKKILFVTTNVDHMNEQPNGTYLIELAVPFQTFLNAGYEIDIMSPKGGSIPIYHSGDTTDIVKETIASEPYISETTNTLTPSEINTGEYAAAIIPGGYGQFWDTHSDEGVLKTIAAIYDAGGILGAVGHGTATLINVKLKSGEYLVKDKAMACFPSAQESSYMEQSNFGALLPYDMEEELQKRGAKLKVYDPVNQINFEIVDAENRLVTASFATGGKFVAEKVLELIQ